MFDSTKQRKVAKIDYRREKRNVCSFKKSSTLVEWSRTDLVNKWQSNLPEAQARALPWDLLKVLVGDLSEDTQLPKQRFNDCIRSQDVGELLSITKNLDVSTYTSADLLLQDRLVVELFKKFDFADSPFNKREKAKLRFFEAEERCRETNFRVGRHLNISTKQNAVIHRAIRSIERILGEFNLTEMLDYSRFGPGASLCCKGAYTTEYYKLSTAKPTVSVEAYPYAEALLNSDFDWLGSLNGIHSFSIAGPFSLFGRKTADVLTVVKANKVTFVPKNAETERSIAIEPYFNLYFQLGIGAMIRQRLFQHARINLDSQTRNQILAMKGSITGLLATIDFSMASDTIALEVVRLLFPPSWFKHLDALRSKNYRMGGFSPFRYYEKFSSMGNGFTFELETLIFYALARASCEELGVSFEDVSVFGDDVILPTICCELFTDVCDFLGFKVNEEKSFTSGNFRESCGEDYLKGFRVRPVFCKELRTVQHVASLANRLSELNHSVGSGSRVNDMLHNAVSLLHSRIPRDVRKLVVGPPSENVDGYIHTRDIGALTASPLVKWNRDLYCWEFPCIQFRATEHEHRNDAAALWVKFGLAVRRRPIPLERMLIGGLKALEHKFRVQDFSDIVNGKAPRVITGRKVGKLVLGSMAVWSLSSD